MIKLKSLIAEISPPPGNNIDGPDEAKKELRRTIEDIGKYAEVMKAAIVNKKKRAILKTISPIFEGSNTLFSFLGYWSNKKKEQFPDKLEELSRLERKIEIRIKKIYKYLLVISKNFNSIEKIDANYQREYIGGFLNSIQNDISQLIDFGVTPPPSPPQ